MALEKEEKLVPHRLASFFACIEKVAREDNGESTSKPVMVRRRCKASFLLDRTFLFASVACIPQFGDDLGLLIFSLFFIVVGCTSFRNMRVATGTQDDPINNWTR